MLLARIDGDVFAVGQQVRAHGLPARGRQARGALLTCPCHDWRFDLRTGVFLDAPELAIATFPVKVEDGKVHVEVGGA